MEEERYRSRSVSLAHRRSDKGRRSGEGDSSVTRTGRERRRSVIETYNTDSQMSAQDNTVWTGGQTYSDVVSDESSDVTMSVYQPHNHILNEIDFPVLGTTGTIKPQRPSQPAKLSSDTTSKPPPLAPPTPSP